MKIEDYNEYYIQGSDHYLIPKDVFTELFTEMINWKEECKNAIDQIIGFESKEILEKPKKIEKIKSNGDEFYSDYTENWINKNKTDAYCEFLMNKINELIDEINNLKEK